MIWDGNVVGVIGAGTMGRGIAQLFAQAGWQVQHYDVVPAALESARTFIAGILDKSVAKARITADEATATLSRIHPVASLNELLPCQLVVEAATEKPDIKYEILKEAQFALSDEGILASNTSSISITHLAASTHHPDRFIGMHFFNPVPVMELVEVIRGLQTSEETLQRTVAIAQTLGKTPVICNDHPGFVSNRILMPMINEAVCCLQDGVADADAIDTIMKLGMGHPMGPLALADLIGIDVCLDILEVLHRELGEDRYRPSPLLRKMVYAGQLGRKVKHGFYRYD
jgi:3-hydroxybutyryl-CoA dehydrogenase